MADRDPVGDLTRTAEAYHRAHQREQSALADLRLAIREVAGTISEREIAQVTGVARATVRKALGKRLRQPGRRENPPSTPWQG